MKFDLFDFMQEHVNRCIELARKKNNDYAGAQSNKDYDPFYNLRRGGEFGLAVRLDDKVSRLLSLSKDGAKSKVTSESVDDTLDDIINYALLFRAMRASKGGGDTQKLDLELEDD